MNTKALQDAGLTDGEIRVYLALLEKGLSTTGPIIEKSGIARSIAYQILEKLIEKGLVSYIIRDKTKYYQASNPEKVLDYAKENAKKVDENIKQIKDILPDLIRKQISSPKSQATIYFGYKGIRAAHENIYLKLKKGDAYCYLGVPAFQPDEQHIYWQKDHLIRTKRGIKMKALFNRDTDKGILKNRNSFKGVDARYMPVDIKTPATFLIYADTTTIILQAPEAIAVEIINKDIANSFMAYFDEFWKLSKPLK